MLRPISPSPPRGISRTAGSFAGGGESTTLLSNAITMVAPGPDGPEVSRPAGASRSYHGRARRPGALARTGVSRTQPGMTGPHPPCVSPDQRLGSTRGARRPHVAAVMRGVVAGVGFLIALATSSAGQEVAQGSEAPIRLPEVTISAPARLPGAPLPDGSIPSSVQVVEGEEIKRSGALTLQDYLRRLPGVTLNDEQGNSFQPGVQLRGFQVSPVTGVPQGISVFVDGVRVNEPTVEEVNFDLIPLDDVERIELIRGPSAVFGRNTLGGSLNIITKRGADTSEVTTQAEGGSFGHQKYRASLGGAGGPIDYYVAGSLLREDGWRDLSAVKLDKAFGKLGYRGGDTDATLSVQYANNRIQQPGSLPPDDLKEDRTRNFTGGDFFAPRLFLGTLNVRQGLGDETALTLNAFARKFDAEQFNASLIGDNTR